MKFFYIHIRSEEDHRRTRSHSNRAQEAGGDGKGEAESWRKQ
jgi:hypothetical protein